MALRAVLGAAFRGVRSARQHSLGVTRYPVDPISVCYFTSARSAQVHPSLLHFRTVEVSGPKISASRSPWLVGSRFFSTKESDTLLRESIKNGVHRGLKEALAKNDGKSVLKLSVIKSGVNAGVKESLKEYHVFIDFAESDLRPEVKSAIEESVLQGLDNFVLQLHKVPPQGGQLKGPYLLKLALKEAIDEGMDVIYQKFSVYVGRGVDLLVRDLALIKEQTKGTDFVQAWCSRLAHQWLNKGFINFVDKSWTILPYVAGVYLFVLFVKTLVESGIPPWEYPDFLNFYRVYGLTSAIAFYQDEKKKKEEAAAAGEK
ncbi:hypothetical protein VPH35_017577 [Triticum aestivum]|uniref:uncharacterized protein isoform X1 n=1 Tax=Triticum aestivum TaxID=4565 RepID=UPI001D00529C|nr:uncharacterized protein LOC123183390 isoform X1 [Triticum aestivum]